MKESIWPAFMMAPFMPPRTWATSWAVFDGELLVELGPLGLGGVATFDLVCGEMDASPSGEAHDPDAPLDPVADVGVAVGADRQLGPDDDAAGLPAPHQAVPDSSSSTNSWGAATSCSRSARP